ncbi:MAG: hypothetical protein AB1611_07305 [bacterium]
MKKLTLNLIIISLLFSIPKAAVAAETDGSIFRLSFEKGSLYSLDLKYRSYVTESIRFRVAQPTITYGHFFSRGWAFFTCAPFIYSNKELEDARGENEEKQVYLLLGNVVITPQYSFKWKGKTIRLSLETQLPTMNRLYELESQETKANGNGNGQGFMNMNQNQSNTSKLGKLNIKENKILTTKPSIIISRAYDPIIHVINLSFCQPLWREENREEIYQYWNAEASYGTYFVVNDKFTLNSDLGISTGKKKENYILKVGTTFFSTPKQGLDIYLLNMYNGLTWEVTAGISYTITR